MLTCETGLGLDRLSHSHCPTPRSSSHTAVAMPDALTPSADGNWRTIALHLHRIYRPPLYLPSSAQSSLHLMVRRRPIHCSAASTFCPRPPCMNWSGSWGLEWNCGSLRGAVTTQQCRVTAPFGKLTTVGIGSSWDNITPGFQSSNPLSLWSNGVRIWP